MRDRGAANGLECAAVAPRVAVDARQGRERPPMRDVHAANGIECATVA